MQNIKLNVKRNIDSHLLATELHPYYKLSGQVTNAYKALSQNIYHLSNKWIADLDHQGVNCSLISK